MDQEIHPCGHGRISIVEINPSLLRMREWRTLSEEMLEQICEARFRSKIGSWQNLWSSFFFKFLAWAWKQTPTIIRNITNLEVFWNHCNFCFVITELWYDDIYQCLDQMQNISEVRQQLKDSGTCPSVPAKHAVLLHLLQYIQEI